MTPREFGVERPDQLPDVVGKVREEKAYYSTSVDWDWPGRPIYLDVVVSPGVGLFASYLAKVSSFPYQHEVLLERGVRYQLTKATPDFNGIWHGQVTVGPPKRKM